MTAVWLIPALPLLGFMTLVVLGRKFGDPGAGIFAAGIVGLSFLSTLGVFAHLLSLPTEERAINQTLFTWISSGAFKVSIGFLADPLSITMCLFITGIGALIHMYSVGYMKGDPKFSKFFVYLNLFIASMLLLVLGDNLLLTFLGWEGVGACSYLLISFWFTDPKNASAGKKAFVTNRVGDFGFMLATFLVWVTLGTVNYAQIRPLAPGLAAGTATAIALLFFLGATGKSAQLPLFVWLPDAMAGPTPVSALIHAATMVTAGVYLLTRLSPIMAEAGWANDVVAWVGALTALVAACAAIAQNDIKKVLAYSTVSQLGYMFLAVGTQSYVAAVFHMITHASFKALLFLGSGSVIHAMAHEQDMRKYGNLRKYLPITYATFMVGWLAIAGIPPLSGFWSKDEILAGVFNAKTFGNLALWVIGMAVALLTAFYMTRQVIMTFFGEEKWRHEELDSHGHEVAEDTEDAVDDHDHHHLTPDHTPHESPISMTLPLMVLAGAAALAGIINLPFGDPFKQLEHWLEPTIVGEHALPPGWVQALLSLAAVTVAVIGILVARAVYIQKKVDPAKIEKPVFAHAWYIDETYAKFMGGPGETAFEDVAKFDQKIVDGAVNGIAGGTVGLGNRLKGLQTGLVRTYGLGMAIGAVALLAYVVTRIGG